VIARPAASPHPPATGQPRPAKAELTPDDQAAAEAFEEWFVEQLHSDDEKAYVEARELVTRAQAKLIKRGISVLPGIADGGRNVPLADRTHGRRAVAVIAYHLLTHPKDEAGADEIAARLAAGHPRTSGGFGGARRASGVRKEDLREQIRAEGVTGSLRYYKDIYDPLSVKPRKEVPELLKQLGKEEPDFWAWEEPGPTRPTLYVGLRPGWGIPDPQTGQIAWPPEVVLPRQLGEDNALTGRTPEKRMQWRIDNGVPQTRKQVRAILQSAENVRNTLFKLGSDHSRTYRTWTQGRTEFIGRDVDVPDDAKDIEWLEYAYGPATGEPVAAAVQPGPGEASSQASAALMPPTRPATVFLPSGPGNTVSDPAGLRSPSGTVFPLASGSMTHTPAPPIGVSTHRPSGLQDLYDQMFGPHESNLYRRPDDSSRHTTPHPAGNRRQHDDSLSDIFGGPTPQTSRRPTPAPGQEFALPGQGENVQLPHVFDQRRPTPGWANTPAPPPHFSPEPTPLAETQAQRQAIVLQANDLDRAWRRRQVTEQSWSRAGSSSAFHMSSEQQDALFTYIDNHPVEFPTFAAVLPHIPTDISAENPQHLHQELIRLNNAYIAWRNARRSKNAEQKAGVKERRANDPHSVQDLQKTLDDPQNSQGITRTELLSRFTVATIKEVFEKLQQRGDKYDSWAVKNPNGTTTVFYGSPGAQQRGLLAAVAQMGWRVEELPVNADSLVDAVVASTGSIRYGTGYIATAGQMRDIVARHGEADPNNPQLIAVVFRLRLVVIDPTGAQQVHNPSGRTDVVLVQLPDGRWAITRPLNTI
jgi:hypothetical protein